MGDWLLFWQYFEMTPLLRIKRFYDKVVKISLTKNGGEACVVSGFYLDWDRTGLKFGIELYSP
jgi:hypothetical protein